MKVNEVLLENKNNAFIKQHIQWLADQLDIKKLPKITLLNDPVDTTFGQYNPDTKSIKLVTGGRHPVDVLRTLAHELTHYKQDIENNLPDGAGETGTDQENEANANAGIVMRDFAQENPDQFGLDKGVAEGSLSEVDRRGFLKGLGAAAVAGAAGGAKAQNVNYAEAAATAVRKAQDAVGSFNSVRFGGQRSRIMNYISQNVNRAILAYCMDTNGYKINEVIDYATNFAYKQADAVPPAITDGALTVTAINVGNAFMNSYDAAIMQKFNEYRQRDTSQQQSTQQQTQQQQVAQQPQQSNSNDIFKPENAKLNSALSLYIRSKDTNPEIHAEIKEAISKFIQTNNNKAFVNDAYNAIKTAIDGNQKRDPEGSAKRAEATINAAKTIIDNLNKASAPVKKDEFESVEQGVAEHIVKHGSQFRLLSKKGKNLGTFPSHKAAAKHEGEVEYFKAHPKK